MNVKLQTVKTLTKKFEKDPTKVIHGMWDEDLNTIYIASNLPTDVQLHTFFHEVGHMLEDILQRVRDDESKADILGAYLMKISGAKTLEEFLERIKTT